MKRRFGKTAVAATVMVLLGTAYAQQRAADPDINWKIRKEALENSQVMHTMHYLSDVYGPRLTGSPNYQKSAEWVVGQLEEWGLENGHLEPWDFERPGWLNERLSAHIISPVKDSLVCEVLAWTPGTNGPTRAHVVAITPPERPTEEDLTAYFAGIKRRISGKVVFVGEPRATPVIFNPQNKRREDSEMAAQFSGEGAVQLPPARQRRGGPGGPGDPEDDEPQPLSGREVNARLDEFFKANDVAVRVNDAGRTHGQIRAFQNRTYDPSKVVPTVVMRNEDYGRIWRILADQTPVELEFDIVNRDYPDGHMVNNPVAEIPGSDKRDEIIMLGGHLDSWHAATGATDNATGVTVMMEAARILKAIGVQPRRTIRVALWGGEEQGLLGSRAYVGEHFGTHEEPKESFGKLVAYFNIDSGTGRARGGTVFGPPEAAAILREIWAPFTDLGMMGATASTSRRRGGSDHTSFNAAGLPGVGLRQDPIEYGSHSWHTNLDTYERVVKEDLQRSAIVVAAAVYELAMRDEMLPRFSDEDMPEAPAERNQQGNRATRSSGGSN